MERLYLRQGLQRDIIKELAGVFIYCSKFLFCRRSSVVEQLIRNQ